MILDNLKECRNEVLWWEFCCLLHDIGKLSDEFLHYRQVWHSLRNGYASKDPHDHDWFSKDSLLKEPEFEALLQFFKTELVSSKLVGNTGKLSVENSVLNHIDPANDNLLCQILRRGDGIDSRYDRNNPLAGCEQTLYGESPIEDRLQRLPEMYRSNVFGKETVVQRGVVEPYTSSQADNENFQPVFRVAGELHAKRKEFYNS